MLTSQIYQKILRPIIFKFDSEKIHDLTISVGKIVGHLPFSSPKYPSISQKYFGIDLSSPIGLAAGFDYQGNLTDILPKIGLGFQTIGTITNLPTEGNLAPRMGRLPKSQALIVNKGFRNPGAESIIKKLSPKNFAIPVGISIGSREASIADIITTFQKFEQSTVNSAYYELNISCPNLQAKKDFYTENNLKALLKTVDALKIPRPIFVKMPISKTDGEILKLLQIISNYSPKGVILGNLKKSEFGNLSGKPTFERSNELIKMAYKKYQKRFLIVGCGGVFCATDAYEKICLGASLVQLITGLVYQGPQLVNDINRGLVDLLQKDGFQNISEAIGSKN